MALTEAEAVEEVLGGPPKVALLTIQHKYGHDSYAFVDKDDAKQTLANFCNYWWNEVRESDDEEPPTNIDTLIRVYFERHAHDSYSLHEAVLNRRPIQA